MQESNSDQPSWTNGKKSIWSRIKSATDEGRQFFHEELWDLDLRPLPRIKTAAISLVRIISIVVRGFIADQCYMQAGTLTYLTLMSLIPILALMFSVSKGFGAQEMLMANLGLERRPEMVQVSETDNDHELQQFVGIEDSWLAELPEEFSHIAITIFSAVERTNVRTLGVIGLLFLLWTVVRMMGMVERSFNSIWGVRMPRTLFRRFSDYISILVVVPILVLCATSINAFLSSEHALEAVSGWFGEFSVVYEFAIRWTLFGAVMLAFVFLLMFMPNTRVRFFPALIGGFIIGIAWYAAQSLYFMAQSGVTQYNTIYGTFAALPFFLVWLHTNWLIILFGGEITFAIQNHHTYHLEQDAGKASLATLSTLGQILMLDATYCYLHDARPWSLEEFVEKHEIPMRMVGAAVYTLNEKGLLRELAEQPGNYLPGRDPGRIAMIEIEQAFRGTVDPRIERLHPSSVPDHSSGAGQDSRQTVNHPTDRNLRSLVENWQPIESRENNKNRLNNPTDKEKNS